MPENGPGRVYVAAEGHVFYEVLESKREDFEERLLSMRLRATLGEELFWRIAEENPERWLGERA